MKQKLIDFWNKDGKDIFETLFAFSALVIGLALMLSPIAPFVFIPAILIVFVVGCVRLIVKFFKKSD